MLIKGQGIPNPLIPQLVTRLSVKESTRQQRGSDPGPLIVCCWFRAKQKATVWQFVKAIFNGENKKTKQILSTSLFFSKNMKKNINNNNAEHKRKIVNGVSSIQLFPCNHKADSRIACTYMQMLWSYWKAEILMFLVSSHSTCAILRECVLKYDKNSYAKIVTIWTYCGTTVSGNALCVYRLRYNSVFLHKWNN